MWMLEKPTKEAQRKETGKRHSYNQHPVSDVVASYARTVEAEEIH